MLDGLISKAKLTVDKILSRESQASVDVFTLRRHFLLVPFSRVLLAQVTRYIGGGTPLLAKRDPHGADGAVGPHTCSPLHDRDLAFSLALFFPRPPIDILSPVLSVPTADSRPYACI